MRECAKCLRPDNAEVSGASIVDLGKAAIEDVGEHSHTQTGDDGLAAFVVVVGDPAERE